MKRPLSYKRTTNPASILRKSTSGRHRPVSYPDGPMTARYRSTQNADWERLRSPSLAIIIYAEHDCSDRIVRVIWVFIVNFQ